MKRPSATVKITHNNENIQEMTKAYDKVQCNNILLDKLYWIGIQGKEYKYHLINGLHHT